MTSVLVTGAAGGIGAATVDAFLAAGCCVVGVDVVADVAGLRSSANYVGVTADVCSPTDLARALRDVGTIHHLVTVAGGALTAETGSDDPLVAPVVWDASIAFNLSSAYYTLTACSDRLVAADGDRSVTFTSSINAASAFGLAAYSAAKAGLSGLMNGLLVPLGRHGIRVNCVLPGTTPTPRTLAEWSHRPDHFAAMRAGVPLGRLGAPADVAATIAAVALQLTHVNGVELAVDGGQSRQH